MTPLTDDGFVPEGDVELKNDKGKKVHRYLGSMLETYTQDADCRRCPGYGCDTCSKPKTR